MHDAAYRRPPSRGRSEIPNALPEVPRCQSAARSSPSRLVVLLALSRVLPARPRHAPAGTLTIGVHVTLVNRWLDPAEVDGLITPFMVLYSFTTRS